jgi:hypothetical protein
MFLELEREERRAAMAIGLSPRRDYLWCENNGILFVRRQIPTNEVPWHPVELPPVNAMINFQLSARCRVRLPIDKNEPWKHGHSMFAGARQSITDPTECLDWLTYAANGIGLRIEEAEVEQVARQIDKLTMKRERDRYRVRQGFTVLGSFFEGVATVLDPKLFERGLITGVGDSKAFGFGFMFFWQRGL